jgi:hypothetical protein
MADGVLFSRSQKRWVRTLQSLPRRDHGEWNVTFKSELFDICSEIAGEFPDWSFSSGAFNNKQLKHSTIMIACGFYFRHGNTPFQPAICIVHKKSAALYKKLFGYDLYTSVVPLQNIAQRLRHTPADFRTGSSIYQDKAMNIALAPRSELAQKRMLDITEARPVVRATMMDGIELISEFYDFSSEDNFLRNLPPKYETRASTIPYSEYEQQRGIMLCIVHMLLGDFDFVERYSSDDYKTIYPKRPELATLMAALPELKRKYAETGKIV